MLFEFISWLATLFGVGMFFYFMFGPRGEEGNEANEEKVDP